MKRGLVVTEGRTTEPQYVERLGQYLRQHSALVSVKSVGVGKDPSAVVLKCIELRDEAQRKGKDYDWCVCLVDRDQHSTLSEAAKLAERERIIFLVSNLKFEVWLLWHVVDKRSSQSSTELDRLVMKHGLVQNKHLLPKFPVEKYQQAVNLAVTVDPKMASGRVGPDPSSALPLLIGLMTGKD